MDAGKSVHRFPRRAPGASRLLAGGGEMGALIRAHDWSRTPLGPIEGWPASLTSTLAICLGSPAPMALWWGDRPESLVFLYNDAYRAVTGRRHPAALGAHAPDLAPEVWPELEEMFAQVLSGHAVRRDNSPMTVDRNGYPEPCWFTFAQSPVLGEDGRVAGVFTVVVETTAQQLAARRLAFEFELGEALRDLHAPEAVLRAAGRRVAEHLGVERCGFGVVQPDGDTVFIAHDWTGPGAPSSSERYRLSELQPEMVACWRAGGLARIDPPEPGRPAGLLAACDEDGPPPASAALCVGVVRDGALVGTLFVQADEPRMWGEDEEQTLRFAAERIWTALGRTRAEARLRDSEARLRLALDAGRMAVWSVDAQGALQVTPELNQLLGLPPDARPTRADLLGHFEPGEVERVEAMGAAALAGGERRFEIEYRHRLPSGEPRWLLVRAELVSNDEGTPQGAIGVVLDVTERREAEERRRESEERLRIAQAAGGIGAFELLPRERRILVSETFCRLWGVPVQPSYRHAELLEQVHPDDLHLLNTQRRDISDEDLHYREYRIRRRDDGEERWMARRGEVVVDAAGRKRFIGVSYDVTDRKRAELALQALNETLEGDVAARTAERDSMWRLSAELMLVSDLKTGRVLAANPAWHRLLGWTAEEMESRGQLRLVHPDDVEATRSGLRQLAEGALVLNFENRMRHKDGTWRLLAWTAVPEGGVIYGLGRDVTEERAAEEALKRTEEALRQSQKMEAVGQLTGGIAHDFNNMLAIVIGSLDLAERRLERGQDAARHLGNAREGALRAAALTQRLLAFSRRQPLTPKVTNLNRLVADMSELMRRTLGETVDLETVLAGGLWSVDVDRNQLESALLNLAVNARDAMPDGGRLTVETANTYLDEVYAAGHIGVTPGRYVMVAVSDRGSGMAPEVVERVFDPFFTTKPVGRGTGLGLSMVYGFVKQSGGHVAIYSELGQGTSVKIYLPRHHGEALEEEAGGAEPADVSGCEVVLVVEDEDRVRQMSVEALKELGYAVHEAASGEEALRLLETLPRLDLLFTDVVMPGMSGAQLAQAVVERAPATKVLYTTGYTRNAVVHNGVLDAGVEFLPKPFSIGDLAAKVRALLDR